MNTPVSSSRYRPPVPTIPARTGAASPVRKQKPPARHRGKKVRREISAGGVVLRQEGNEWYVALLLTEHKRGKVWVLPKGHVELHTGERIAEAAKREVQEEAGITELVVKNQLGVSRFSFRAEEAIVHKTVHYFLMITTQKTITPQAEEGLLEGKWFPLQEAIEALEYDTDKDIVIRAKVMVTKPLSRVPSSRKTLRIHS